MTEQTRPTAAVGINIEENPSQLNELSDPPVKPTRRPSAVDSAYAVAMKTMMRRFIRRNRNENQVTEPARRPIPRNGRILAGDLEGPGYVQAPHVTAVPRRT